MFERELTQQSEITTLDCDWTTYVRFVCMCEYVSGNELFTIAHISNHHRLQSDFDHVFATCKDDIESMQRSFLDENPDSLLAETTLFAVKFLKINVLP